MCLLLASTRGVQLIDIKMCARVSRLAAAGRHVQAARPEAPGAWLQDGGSDGSQHRHSDDVAQKQASLRRRAIAIVFVGTWCDTMIKSRRLAGAGLDWPMPQIMGVVVMSSAADGWYTSHSLLGGFTLRAVKPHGRLAGVE